MHRPPAPPLRSSRHSRRWRSHCRSCHGRIAKLGIEQTVTGIP
jgi:hypothetical protein